MKIFLILISFFCLSGPSALLAQTQDGSQSPVKKTAKFTFKHEVYEFGDIVEGDSVTRVFAFENTGNIPLIITEIQTTCGCTTPHWDKKPIKPGKNGRIVVTFNSKGKTGRQNKVITVRSNAEQDPVYLKLRGSVVPPLKKEEEKESE